VSEEQKVNRRRRRILTAATSAVGAAGVSAAAIPFVSFWRPSARARAAGAPVKIDIAKLEPGQMVVAGWRGRPVYVVRRTPEQIAVLEEMGPILSDPDSLRPQQPDYIRGPERALNPEYMVLIGLCTHLGCAPKFRPQIAAPDLGRDWRGGFFCPCHGSRFDLSGRVYRGAPAAPNNLVVPPYRYENEHLLVIGVDAEPGTLS